MFTSPFSHHYSRRIFLAQTAVALMIPSLTGCDNCSTNAQTPTPEKSETPTVPVADNTSKKKESGDKTLVLYFSHSGNTRKIAQYVHEFVGGELVELKTVDAYPENYDKCVDQARKELEANFRPKLLEKLNETFAKLDDYETVYLGYPNWWGTTPMAFATMLETHDFSTKTIIPFCTHEGSALGASTRDIAKWSPKSTLLNGLAVRGRSVASAKPEVEKWLRQLGKTK